MAPLDILTRELGGNPSYLTATYSMLGDGIKLKFRDQRIAVRTYLGENLFNIGNEGDAVLAAVCGVPLTDEVLNKLYFYDVDALSVKDIGTAPLPLES